MIWIASSTPSIASDFQPSWLALGDSYTIGEGVPLHASYPYQTVALMRRQGLPMRAPEIVAQTGWTTGELQAHLATTPLASYYDFATVLIGVNNQYRGLSLDEGQKEFEALVRTAIQAVDGQRARVAVISIPDWGVTPFAAQMDRDPAQVAREIDAWNLRQKVWAANAGIMYFDITGRTRANVGKEGYLAADGLHPGPREYADWAELLAHWMRQQGRAPTPTRSGPRGG